MIPYTAFEGLTSKDIYNKSGASSAQVLISLLLIKIVLRQGCHTSGKSQGKVVFFKVREMSGNFEICQGKNEF